MISRATDTILDQAMGELAELHDAGQGWPELQRHLEQRWLAERAPGFERVPVEEREAAKESLLFRASEAAGHWESLEENSLFRRRYQVQACIGRGSGGRVFRAIDSKTGGLVALKEVALRDSVPDGAWLLAAQTQARVQHPSVVNVFDIHRTARGAVVVMEFVGQEGRPAPTGSQVQFTQRQAVEAAYVLAHTLSVAHAQGIAHRDVTPANVMVTNATAEGSVPPLTQVQLKVSDFGLNGLHAASGDVRSESTLEWQGEAAELLRCRLGTPGFMARERARFQPLDDSALPEEEREQLRSESRRGDVFELGATLRYWLTGKKVWPLEARFDDLASLTPDASGIHNRRLARIVRSALGVERPYENVDALKADLGAWLEAKPTSHDGRLATNGLRLYRWRAILSTAIAVAGVLASSFFAHSLQETQNGLDLLERDYSHETISAARRVTDLEHQVQQARAEGNQDKEGLLRGVQRRARAARASLPRGEGGGRSRGSEREGGGHPENEGREGRRAGGGEDGEGSRARSREGGDGVSARCREDGARQRASRGEDGEGLSARGGEDREGERARRREDGEGQRARRREDGEGERACCREDGERSGARCGEDGEGGSARCGEGGEGGGALRGARCGEDREGERGRCGIAAAKRREDDSAPRDGGI